MIRVSTEEGRAKASDRPRPAVSRDPGDVPAAGGADYRAGLPIRDVGAGSMAARGLNLADEELEKLVAVEIRRRLARIRLQDLDAEIKKIFQQAVDRTVREMLPQIKTEIILSVVKLLKNK
jgi:hypothetical protein